MYWGTFAIPVTRPSVVAVCRVFVSDHSGIAGDREVARQPHERSGRGEQREAQQPAALGQGQALGAAAQPARNEVHQVEPVQPREGPRLGAQQAREREQHEHRRPGAAMRVSTSSAQSNEQQVGDVHVGAHAVGEHRHAREEEQRGERSRSPAEPFAAEAVDDPAACRQREEAERHRDVVGCARAERREHQAERLEQRVRGGRDRDAVGGGFAARELPAPGERVERVVVGEADARDHPQQQRTRDDRHRRAPTARRCGRSRRPSGAWSRRTSGGRYPLRRVAGPDSGAAPWGRG